MNPTDAEIRDLIDAGRGIGLARPLAMEVLRLRAENAKLRELVADLRKWCSNHHRAMCATAWMGACNCGCDALQMRINEVTT